MKKDSQKDWVCANPGWWFNQKSGITIYHTHSWWIRIGWDTRGPFSSLKNAIKTYRKTNNKKIHRIGDWICASPGWWFHQKSGINLLRDDSTKFWLPVDGAREDMSILHRSYSDLRYAMICEEERMR